MNYSQKHSYIPQVKNQNHHWGIHCKISCDNFSHIYAFILKCRHSCFSLHCWNWSSWTRSTNLLTLSLLSERKISEICASHPSVPCSSVCTIMWSWDTTTWTLEAACDLAWSALLDMIKLIKWKANRQISHGARCQHEERQRKSKPSVCFQPHKHLEVQWVIP